MRKTGRNQEGKSNALDVRSTHWYLEKWEKALKIHDPREPRFYDIWDFIVWEPWPSACLGLVGVPSERERIT